MSDWYIPNLGKYLDGALEIPYMPESDDDWNCSFLIIRTVLDDHFSSPVGASVEIFVETSMGLSGVAMSLSVSMEYNSHLHLDW